jgi:hypothetical protein
VRRIIERTKIFAVTVDRSRLETRSKPFDSVSNDSPPPMKNPGPRTGESRGLVRVLGKLCPRCGGVGSVLCESERRIIYECPNGHAYETRRGPQEIGGE